MGDTPDDPEPLKEPPGIPPGAFLALPQPTQQGEVIPPIPTTFSVGLTDPDSKGHRWAVLRATDGTVTVDFRMPWQMAAQLGMGIAQGLAQMQAQAEQAANGGLQVVQSTAGLDEALRRMQNGGRG